MSDIAREPRWWGTALNRRTLLRSSLLGGAGLAAAALVGCGGDDDDETPSSGGGDTAAPATATAADGGAATATATAAAPAAEDVDLGPRGKLVQDPELPFPFNFPEPSTTPKAGGRMVVAATWNFQTIDPVTSAAGGTVTIPNTVYNRLLALERGPDAPVFGQGLKGELAASWERSPDGLTFSFTMSEGVNWQNVAPLNGRPFVADDARFALERYANEGVHKAYYLNVAGFETVNDQVFNINMARPTADFLNPLGSNKQTIFPRELVEDGSIETQAVGTGPMILTELIAGQQVAFDKNPDYFERDVLLDGFTFRLMPDAVARLAAFRVGQVDYAYSLVANISDLNAVLNTNPDIQVNMIPVVTQNTLGLNLTLQKYEDERVRRAISIGIDRSELLDIVFDGLGRALHVIPWPYVYDEEPTIESGKLGNWLRHDQAEATKLLQAAGADGMEMNNSYYPYSTAYAQTAEVVQAQLSRAGINMTGGAVDYTEFNSQWVPRMLPDASTSAWATSGYDADNWFHGQVHSESPGNRWRIADAEIDAWAEAQQVELDPEARRDIWQKIWDKDLDQIYRVPLPLGFSFHVYQPWLRGVRFTGTSPGDNNSYYSWGPQLAHAWLDK